MKLRLLALSLVVALAAAALAAAGTTATSPPTITLPTKPMSATDAAAVAARARLLTIIYPNDIPGVLIGVWDPAEGFYTGGFGTADTTSGRAPAPADSFRIGSVTKTFTATLVLQLVAEGKLRLDGRVASYAPKLAKRHPQLGLRTIRQLLSMRSGLPEYTDNMMGASSSKGWTSKVWEPNQLIDFAFKSGPVRRPNGTPAVYTNTNYIALGEVLTTVTGKTLPELMRTRLLEPMGLKRTVYPTIADTTLSSPSTRGYVGPGGTAELGGVAPGTDVTDWSASWGGAAGIMSSTLDDMARWAAARFGSALLPAGLRAKRTAVAAPLNEYWRYGLGLLQLGEWEGHYGGIPGWTTMAFRNTKTGTIVVASVNACCGPQTEALQLFVLDRLYPGTTGGPNTTSTSEER